MVLTAVLTRSGYPQNVTLTIEEATDSRVETYCPSAANPARGRKVGESMFSVLWTQGTGGLLPLYPLTTTRAEASGREPDGRADA